MAIKQALVTLATLVLTYSAQFVNGQDDEISKSVRSILDRHCVRCHGAKESEKELRFDTLPFDFENRSAATIWVEIRNQINLGEMPPNDEPQLDVKEIRLVSQWIATNLKHATSKSLGAPGQVLMRRLNRHEYTHTIADLLHMKFPSGESPLDFLPPDGTAIGFDKVSGALTLDPSLMDQYYRVARRIADRAIVDGPPEFPTEKMKLEYEEMADSNAIGYLFNRLGIKAVPGGIQLVEGNTRSFGMLRYPGRRDNNVAPTNGFYRFTVRAGGRQGKGGEIPRLLLTHSHPDDKMRKILEVDIKAPWDKPKEYSVIVPRDTLGGELQLELVNQKGFYMSQRPGEHFMQRNNEVGKKSDFKESIRLAGRKVAEGWGGDRSTPDPEKLDESKYPRVFLDYLEVEGPLYDQWPPKSHTSLLVGEKNQSQDLDYARRVFEPFLSKAWRRPVAEAEVETIIRVVKTELDNGGSFHDAIRIGLTACLTSPKFLFLVEPSSAGQSNFKIGQYEIASRLSYFLWNSMPDEELFELAHQEKLRDPQVLARQVDRMVDDPRISRFVESFGRQWLKTESFNAFAPDRNLYRAYDENLSQAIEREPIEFFSTILRSDLSALSFINSDFVVVNGRLARHYEIEGVEGEHFRKVPIVRESVRGGLLAMAGVHQAGSDGVRTKPVSRAAYVLDVLFNDPPDPPPPNAGEIEPNIRGKQLTVRERLLQHQEVKSCAACHERLDPYGLALENFNVIGNWRKKQDGENFRGDRTPEIVVSGKLPNGKSFDTFEQFRLLLMEQKDRFRRGIAEKMLVYALGKPVESADATTVDEIVSKMKSSKDTFRSLIKAIVCSDRFLVK